MSPASHFLPVFSNSDLAQAVLSSPSTSIEFWPTTSFPLTESPANLTAASEAPFIPGWFSAQIGSRKSVAPCRSALATVRVPFEVLSPTVMVFPDVAVKVSTAAVPATARLLLSPVMLTVSACRLAPPATLTVADSPETFSVVAFNAAPLARLTAAPEVPVTSSDVVFNAAPPATLTVPAVLMAAFSVPSPLTVWVPPAMLTTVSASALMVPVSCPSLLVAALPRFSADPFSVSDTATACRLPASSALWTSSPPSPANVRLAPFVTATSLAVPMSSAATPRLPALFDHCCWWHHPRQGSYLRSLP